MTPVPESIGPYKIESLLEKGGMSILYLATHPETEELTVIKVLSPKFLTRPEVVERFLHETKIIGLPDHPQIVKLYSSGKWEEGLYIAMEFVQGISLKQYLLQYPLSLKRALEIVIEIAYALCHLHTHGVIHRDLKPENILITESGSVKVIDFGIAQLLTEKPDPEKPAKQRLIGTPIYMSPEQREDPDTVSYPSDIYALGIITYELILGKLCHGQIHLSLMPKGLRKVLYKCLQPDPNERYQDVVDFITDISAYLNSDEMEKEKKVGDILNELSENLKRVQQKLVPEEGPDWPGVTIVIALHKASDTVKFYTDFFKMENDFGLIIGECAAKGAEGLVYSGILRGMTKALCRLSNQPVEVATLLNDLLSKDAINQTFYFNSLVLSPEKNALTYLSCGYDNLWIIPKETKVPEKISNSNPLLGEKEVTFNEVTREWKSGDQLVLSSAFSEVFFEKILNENTQMDPKKLVETVLHRIKTGAAKQFKDSSLAIICIERT